MRTAFIRTLIELAKTDKRIFLLVGDLGYSVIEPFIKEFPERFVNVGIAEQDMTGIAAGIALCGNVVFTYSIGNFPTLRCFEQIRNDVCYHNADVKIMAVGAGLAYGALGVSHHATEDLAVMRALPNMVVVAPGDPMEAALAVRAAVSLDGPCYIRLGKAGEPEIHQKTPDFQIGKAIKVREGVDATLITTGGMLYNAVQAAETLQRQGVQVRVLSMHTIKPIDTAAIIAAARETGNIITVEEHSIIGGLGSAVAEILAESGNLLVKFERLGVKDTFCSHVGNQEYLQKVYSLSVEAIIAAVRSSLGSSASDGI